MGARSASPWRGRRVLITAGPTREPLDPVRFLTNASSGRMGWALARAARDRGARVTLVSGPVCLPPPRGVRCFPVTTALQMRRSVLARCAAADVFIASAAVGDWSLPRPARRKIKRTGAALRLTLRPNPDILAEVSRRLRARRGRAVLVGFALETSRRLQRAAAKLRRKDLDLVVANGPDSLASSSARLSLIDREGRLERLPRLTKRRAAAEILRRAERFL